MWLLILGIGLISATSCICYHDARLDLTSVIVGLPGCLELAWLAISIVLIEAIVRARQPEGNSAMLYPNEQRVRDAALNQVAILGG